MPIVDEKAPREADFDALLDLLRPLDSDCATVFNCQGKREIQCLKFAFDFKIYFSSFGGR